jgi:hypothetical protein
MTIPACIDLAKWFGSEYQIRFDEADNRQRRATIDPWLFEIPCRRGVIHPYGGTVLAVMVDGRPKLASQLRRLACCTVLQDGDEESTFGFDVNHFPEVAAIVLPRRRRQISEAERQRLADLSKRHGFVAHQSDVVSGAPTHANGKSDPNLVLESRT